MFAILAEVAIDTFWLDRPRIFTSLWREHIFEKKIVAAVIVGLAVVICLYGESSQGTVADDKADEIQRYQQDQIADAENRSVLAVEQNTMLRRALGPPMLYVDQSHRKEFFRLNKFTSTPILVQGLLNLSNMDGVASFRSLGIVGWQRIPPSLNWTGSTPPGITIYSRRPKPWETLEQSYPQSPYKMPFNTSEEKAWAAGEALKQYLESTSALGISHLQIPVGPNGDVDSRRPDLASLNLPKNGVLVIIGEKFPEDEILNELDSQELFSGGFAN
jgi:hypothetical protein